MTPTPTGGRAGKISSMGREFQRRCAPGDSLTAKHPGGLEVVGSKPTDPTRRPRHAYNRPMLNGCLQVAEALNGPRFKRSQPSNFRGPEPLN